MSAGEILRGRYRLDSLLARDEGTGAYWHAFDTFLDRAVTIKCLPVGVTERLLRRYEREARILGALEHSALPKVFDADLHESRPFLVMEAMKGEPLVKSEATPMAVPEALAFVEALGGALELAHARGFLHRRVSPEHVIRLPDGEPKLIGFGRASLGGSRSTTTSDIQSTPSVYLSPELFVADGRDVRSDVYGLATVLLYLLTGRPPVDGIESGFAAVMRALMGQPRRRVRDFRPEVDARIDETVARALDLNPSRRPSSVGAWLRELRRLDPLVQPDGAESGTRINDRYVIESRLGQGTYGTVFLAHDDELLRHVAIKFVEDEASGLIDEARAMAQVTHPNVVQVFDVGRHRGRAYLVMENLPGESVEARLGDSPMPRDEAVSILAQTALGLDALHRAGLVHGDVKPSNILIGPAFRVCVADFGLVRTPATWATTDIGGTPAYFAPERGKRTIDTNLAHRIDLYSLGVLAYELLTGSLPFAGASPLETIQAHVSAPIPRPSSHHPSLAAFDGLVASALAKDPRERCESAAAFRDALFEAHAASPRAGDAPSFLVLDPSEDGRTRTESLLLSNFDRAEVETAASAREANARLKYRSYDAVLFELELPDENGVEFAASLRANMEGAPPLVAVTSAGSAADWQVLSALGVEGFLFKPVDEALLLVTLQRLLTPR